MIMTNEFTTIKLECAYNSNMQSIQGNFTLIFGKIVINSLACFCIQIHFQANKELQQIARVQTNVAKVLEDDRQMASQTIQKQKAHGNREAHFIRKENDAQRRKQLTDKVESDAKAINRSFIILWNAHDLENLQFQSNSNGADLRNIGFIGGIYFADQNLYAFRNY